MGELHFIMTALWLHQFYYIFSFLFLATLILVATCAEITIVMTYFQLCSEDYRWWWRSFLCSGSCAFYLFIYSILYFKQELDISGSVSYLFYFGYNFLFAVTLFLITGCIGYFSSFWFITKIYGAKLINHIHSFLWKMSRKCETKIIKKYNRLNMDKRYLNLK